MSDLFKKNAPRLTEDEESRLWQRVRAIPEEVDAERATERGRASVAAGSARPWWRGLFAAPAFRYGAPALAVLVAATLFVLRQNPHAPAPTVSTRATTEMAPEADVPRAPEATALPEAAMPAPAPARERVATGKALDQAPSDARRELASVDEPQEALGKKQEAGRDAGKFASEPPADAKLKAAQPLASEKEGAAKVTVIKGGKDDGVRGGRTEEVRVKTDELAVEERSSSTAAPAAPAAPPTTTTSSRPLAQKKEAAQTKSEAPVAANESSEGAAALGGAAPEPAPAPLGARGPMAMFRGDASSSPWQTIVAGTSAGKWIEVVPSLFDDGGVVVMAGAAESGLSLLVDASGAVAAARAPRFVRDASGARWGVAAWVYDRAPSALSPQVVRAGAASPVAEPGFIVTRRASFRDAPDAVQIAYLAAEGERATAISASASGRARFDRVLVEANGLASRHPTDARLVRVIQLLTEARAHLR